MRTPFTFTRLEKAVRAGPLLQQRPEAFLGLGKCDRDHSGLQHDKCAGGGVEGGLRAEGSYVTAALDLVPGLCRLRDHLVLAVRRRRLPQQGVSDQGGRPGKQNIRVTYSGHDL